MTDAFAPLRAGAGADPAFGGYRILRRGAAARPVARTNARRPSMGRLVGALLAAALGAAAVSGGASCRCHGAALASPETARFAYAQQTALVEPPATTRSSPVSTSAITPLPTARWRGGVLPAKLEAIADAGPQPLRLVAARADDGSMPDLPEIVVASPPLRAIRATDVRPDGTATARAKRGDAPAKRRAIREGRRPSRAGAAPPLRAPRWALQMYETPWQSKAFSYFR